MTCLCRSQRQTQIVFRDRLCWKLFFRICYSRHEEQAQLDRVVVESVELGQDVVGNIFIALSLQIIQTRRC